MEKRLPRGSGRLRRMTVASFVMASAVVSLSILDVGEAHADQVYVPCPMPVAGAGCGFEGSVSEGSVTIVFRYAGPGGYGSEKFEQPCQHPTCWIGQYAVPRSDRTPAGFDVRTGGAFVSWREHV